MSRIRETGNEYLDVYKENANENIYKYKGELNKQTKAEDYNRK